MALSQSVENSLKEAEQNLRNALAFAARAERPMVCSVIADLISRMNQFKILMQFLISWRIETLEAMGLLGLCSVKIENFFLLQLKLGSSKVFL